MTEGSRPSPKSTMKVVMNIRVIMVTAEHYFSYVRLVLTKNFLNPVPDQWITVNVEENPQRILNYAQDKRCSNEIWVEST